MNNSTHNNSLEPAVSSEEWLDKPWCGCPVNNSSSFDLEVKASKGETMDDLVLEHRNTRITASLSSSTGDKNKRSGELNDGMPNTDDDDVSTVNSYNDDSTNNGASRASVMCSRFIARNPCLCLCSALLLSITLSLVGYFVGDFTVSAELDGWLSRGTLIANQNTQTTLVNRNTQALFFDEQDEDEASWEILTSEIQPSLTSHDPTQRRRALSNAQPGEFVAASSAFLDLPGCDVSYYTDGKFLGHDENLWPVWETKNASISALDPPVLKDICIAEQNTQTALEKAGLCGGCVEGCLPPISLVSFARVLVGDRDVSMDCDQLIAAWTLSLPLVKDHLRTIVTDMRANVHSSEKSIDASDPLSAVALFVDSGYGVDGNEIVRYTSSIFATVYSGRPVKDVFAIRDQLDRAESSEYIKGTYDTPGEDFSKLITDPLLLSDIKLVTGSLIVTTLAMMIHTRSLWLTAVGLAQIALSFPLAYFFYSVVFRLSFFPFLNFIGFFVVFAIGADDIFVAVDKWKNARISNPGGSIGDIASIALPSATRAMLLTTITTAIAFLATAICPVPALKLFAIFSGLLIVIDYILCLLFIFPALCIFDRYLCCDALWWCGGTTRPEPDRKSCIQRILGGYFFLLHRGRYLWLFVILGATVGCSFVAKDLKLPVTSEVRLLRPDHEFERNYRWRLRLLISELERERGTRVWFMWGVSPADTGNHKNPRESSAIVLDETFDPSPVENQLYLRDFCDDLHSQSFASQDMLGSLCPMNYFDSWLQGQAVESSPNEEYQLHCNNATQLPLPQETLHPCMIAFAKAEKYSRVLFKDGKVKIIRLPFRQVGVLWDVGHEKLADSWDQLNDFTLTRNAFEAPPGVDRVFGTSHDFWWWDTNASIISTAAGSIAIALTAAFVVVLLSTRSFAVTFVAVFSIGFILLSSTAVLVALGWTLGFLESVCFAILVGISCDFVLHFGHAYCALPGIVSRSERTEYALITMGPSILAAAATTIAASIAMLFASINFFHKFGNILLWSLVMGVLGSMFVFLVVIDVLGPLNPGGICLDEDNNAELSMASSQVKRDLEGDSGGGGDDASDDSR